MQSVARGEDVMHFLMSSGLGFLSADCGDNLEICKAVETPDLWVEESQKQAISMHLKGRNSEVPREIQVGFAWRLARQDQVQSTQLPCRHSQMLVIFLNHNTKIRKPAAPTSSCPFHLPLYHLSSTCLPPNLLFTHCLLCHYIQSLTLSQHYPTPASPHLSLSCAL